MQVKFIENREMRDANGEIVASFTAGQVVDFADRPDQAQRWLRRNACVVFDEAAEKKNAPAKEKGAKGGDSGAGDGADDAGQSKGGAPAGGAKR